VDRSIEVPWRGASLRWADAGLIGLGQLARACQLTWAAAAAELVISPSDWRRSGRAQRTGHWRDITACPPPPPMKTASLSQSSCCWGRAGQTAH